MTANPNVSLPGSGDALPACPNRYAETLASVEYLLCFDGLIDAIQAHELKGSAITRHEATMYLDGKRCTVVHGSMPYDRLVALHFCRRNSTCSISVAALGVYDHALWSSARVAPA